MRRKKPRKRTNASVPAKGRLREMADELWSLIVKHDWANRCAICGSTVSLNSHHLFPRRHQTLRFDLRNGICLCGHCHVLCPKMSPHLNGLEFKNWLSLNHPNVSDWAQEQIDTGYEFTGTLTPWHYIDELQRLRRFAEPDDFERICGVKFSRYLEEQSALDTN